MIIVEKSLSAAISPGPETEAESSAARGVDAPIWTQIYYIFAWRSCAW
jgi:hypothetical protein